MTDITTLADALINAHLTGTRIEPALPGLSRADGLAVQSTVAAALGDVAGFKIGPVPDAPPILAPIMARYGVENGATRTINDRLGIELEVGFTLIRALPSNTLPATPQDYFRPFAILELVDTRLAGAAADTPAFKLADFQINAGLVIGEGPSDWDGSDFTTLGARLVTETETVLDGPATVPGGSALSNLDVLISHLGDHCGGLKVGQTVITGSLCGLPYFPPDTRLSGWIEGLGSVSVNLSKS